MLGLRYCGQFYTDKRFMECFSSLEGSALGIRVLILFFLLSQVFCSALELTPQEREYLQMHNPVRVCVDPNWDPYERINKQGKHEGIAAELLQLVAKRTGVTLVLVPTKDWPQSLSFSQEGRCDVLSFLNQTLERDEWLLFTDPVFTEANVLIARTDEPYIADLAGLIGKTIVLPSGTSVEEHVRLDYPNLEVVNTETEEEALQMVADGRADLTIRSLIVAAHELRRGDWLNLMIIGQLPEYVNQFRIGVLRNEPLLRDILNKGVHSITAQERGAIVHKHIPASGGSGIGYELFIKIMLGVLVVFGLVAYRQFRLKAYNRELQKISQTDALTGLNNRMKLNEFFRLEVERAARYDRPLVVIMLDIDHFKRVNDEFGHQVGDKVLIAIARNLATSVRNTDVVGRWGGEEFLALCPETTLKDGLVLAERICTMVRADVYASGRPQSVSAGVAEFSAGETVDSLLQRADRALYEAKHAGRDQVCPSVTPTPQSPAPPQFPSHVDPNFRNRPISIYVQR